MKVLSRRILREFYEDPKYLKSKEDLESWYHEAKAARWQSPHDIKARYPDASFVGNNRVVFNICRNEYRLVVKINYAAQIIFIRFVGTHKEYDRIDAKEI